MRFVSISSSLAVIAALALAPAATAQFTDSFDSYTAGSAIEGQAGWQNWDICATGNQTFNTVSTAQAASGANSLRMIGATAAGGGCSFCSDTTNEFGGTPLAGGVYTFSINTYIPTGFVGQAYIILLNEYGNCGGPYEWSTQIHFEGTTGDVITDNLGGNLLPVNGDQLIVYDTWVELRAEIDLPNNTVRYFYNNVEMYTDNWLGAGGTPQIAALDLFPGTDDTTEWFVDDVSLMGGVAPGQIGTTYCNPAVANSTGVPAEISAFGSAVAADNDVTLTTTDMPNGSFGYYLTSMTQGNVPMPNGSLGTLCLGGAVGRYVGAGQIMNTGATGMISLTLDLTQHPTPTGLVTVTAGQTWNFQMWHRDVVAGMLESNFSNGVSIAFN